MTETETKWAERVREWRASNQTLEEFARGRSQPISDRAGGMCVVGDRVIVDIHDGNTLSLNPATPEKGDKKKGTGCPQRWASSTVTPAIAGFQASSSPSETPQVVRKNMRYIVGSRTPGTAVPLAVAAELTGKQAKWTTPLFGGPDADAVERSATFIAASDRGVLTQYQKRASGHDNELHLVLLDIQNGAKKWDVPLRSLRGMDRVYGIGIGERFGYIVRMSSVEVHSLDNGALVTTFGDETYDK